MAPRVVYVVLCNISKFKEFSREFEKDGNLEHWYLVCWEEGQLKPVCVGSKSLDQPVPGAELVPLSRVVCCTRDWQIPNTIRGCSPLLLRSPSEGRCDGR